jgi:hypothetical protein
MKSKIIPLGLASLVIAAFSALPALASASGSPEVRCIGVACGGITIENNITKTTSTTDGTTVSCTSSTGTGNYSTPTSGTLSQTFHGCKTPSFFNATCTTPGQAAGTIKTGTSVFHNVYIDPNKTTPGVLITQPAAGPYTTATCGGFLHVEVSGNLIGHLESPACGGSSTAFKLGFAATSHGQQKYKQLTTTGTIFDLTAKVNGGAATTAAVNAGGTITFGGKTATLTCV